MSSTTTRLTGINLKSSPLGESDKIMSILTKEEGLIRAIANGSRKQPSKMGGRMDLLVVNELMISRSHRFTNLDKGSSLARISHAQTVQSFPKLSRSLKRLTAAQYLGEVALQFALSDFPQEDLLVLLIEHLSRIEQSPDPVVLPLLAHGIYHLLALNGVAPQVQSCQMCQGSLPTHTHQDHYFSHQAGGMLCDPCAVIYRSHGLSVISTPMLKSLQVLPQSMLATEDPDAPVHESTAIWLSVERLLRRVVEDQADRPIQSALLVDSCWGLRL